MDKWRLKGPEALVKQKEKNCKNRSIRPGWCVVWSEGRRDEFRPTRSPGTGRGSSAIPKPAINMNKNEYCLSSTDYGFDEKNVFAFVL